MRHGAATVPYTIAQGRLAIARAYSRVAARRGDRALHNPITDRDEMEEDPIAAAIDYLGTEDHALRRRKKHRLPVHSYAQSDHEFFFKLCARHLEAPFTNEGLARAVVD